MNIDITIIDNCIINKNKQLHQFDETACALYTIVVFCTDENVVASSRLSPLNAFNSYLINFLLALQSAVMKSLSSFVSLYPL